MAGRSLFGGGTSVLWSAGRGCYGGLWCISGLGWGIQHQDKNVLIFFIRA